MLKTFPQHTCEADDAYDELKYCNDELIQRLTLRTHIYADDDSCCCCSNRVCRHRTGCRINLDSHIDVISRRGDRHADTSTRQKTDQLVSK